MKKCKDILTFIRRRSRSGCGLWKGDRRGFKKQIEFRRLGSAHEAHVSHIHKQQNL